MLFHPSCVCVQAESTRQSYYIYLTERLILYGGLQRLHVYMYILLCHVVYIVSVAGTTLKRLYAPGLAIVRARIMYNTCCWSISVPNDVTTWVYKLVTVSLFRQRVYIYIQYDNNNNKNMRVNIDSQIDLRRYRFFPPLTVVGAYSPLKLTNTAARAEFNDLQGLYYYVLCFYHVTSLPPLCHNLTYMYNIVFLDVLKFNTMFSHTSRQTMAIIIIV